jgi:succinate dehydrogenase / fumarate reductase iron-sulfur subunit
MVAQMDREGFGNCTNQYECEAVCPKEIRVQCIAQMNRDYLRASVACDEEGKRLARVG